MRSDDYNKYLTAIRAANDISDNDLCRELLRKIYAQMVAQYGPNEDDVDFLYRKFRLHID